MLSSLIKPTATVGNPLDLPVKVSAPITPPMTGPPSPVSEGAPLSRTASSNSISGLTRKGLKPVGTMEGGVQFEAKKALDYMRTLTSDIEKYNFLANLRSNSPSIFYSVLIQNLGEITPLIYTPTIGTVCQTFSTLPPPIAQNHPALYLSILDKGNIAEIIENFEWKQNKGKEINGFGYNNAGLDMIVVTDGSRILGLGDLGVGGVGIPIGKLSLYIGGAGLHPDRTLPVVLDIGTNNSSLLNDPHYIGLRQPRISNEEAAEFVAEFMEAIKSRWSECVIQFEDFNTELAFDLLETNRNKYPCFNDDIQGTGAVSLAGFINGVKLSGTSVEDQRIVFFGAGSAAVGIAEMIVSWFVTQGIEETKAREMIWLVDSKGLISDNRGDKLAAHKRSLSRKNPETPILKDLLSVVQHVKPTALLGLSTVGGSFTEPVIRYLKSINNRPIIFPLSNPVSKSECTFKQALEWTDGTCIFASGSPFEPVEVNGKLLKAGQGNNMYVFPPIGLGSVIAKVSSIPESLIQASAIALSNSLNEQEKAEGLIYPELNRIREISVSIARDVVRVAQRENVDGAKELRFLNDSQLEAYIRERMYDPHDTFMASKL